MISIQLKTSHGLHTSTPHYRHLQSISAVAEASLVVRFSHVILHQFQYIRIFIYFFNMLCNWILGERKQSIQHTHTCGELYIGGKWHHSSRIARPRFVARASLTELKACGGKLASMKSGRSLAIDNSCSLFSNRLVWLAFSKGRSCQLSNFNCAQTKLH